MAADQTRVSADAGDHTRQSLELGVATSVIELWEMQGQQNRVWGTAYESAVADACANRKLTLGIQAIDLLIEHGPINASTFDKTPLQSLSEGEIVDRLDLIFDAVHSAMTHAEYPYDTAKLAAAVGDSRGGKVRKEITASLQWDYPVQSFDRDAERYGDIEQLRVVGVPKGLDLVATMTEADYQIKDALIRLPTAHYLFRRPDVVALYDRWIALCGGETEAPRDLDVYRSTLEVIGEQLSWLSGVFAKEQVVGDFIAQRDVVAKLLATLARLDGDARGDLLGRVGLEAMRWAAGKVPRRRSALYEGVLERIETGAATVEESGFAFMLLRTCGYPLHARDVEALGLPTCLSCVPRGGRGSELFADDVRVLQSWLDNRLDAVAVSGTLGVEDLLALSRFRNAELGTETPLPSDAEGQVLSKLRAQIDALIVMGDKSIQESLGLIAEGERPLQILAAKRQ